MLARKRSSGDDVCVASQRVLRLAVGAAALVFMTGCGHTSPHVFSADQVQKAFSSSGLVTRFLMDCRNTPTGDGRKLACPLTVMVGPHATAVIGDFREKMRTPYGAPLEAMVFDSARAADAYEVANSIYNVKTGKTVTPTQRLQRANVVVYVIRKGDYRRKAEAALAALG